MKRRNFIAATLAGVAALPLAKRSVVQSKPKSDQGQWHLTHRESQTGLRAYDLRIVVNEFDAQKLLKSSEGEQVLLAYLKNNRMQRLV